MRTPPLSDAEAALVELGALLRDGGYRFVTVTPESHRRVNARPGHAVAKSLRDVFGWSRPFPSTLLPAPMLELLRRSGRLQAAGDLWKSQVRFSTLGDQLFAHSAFPTVEQDAVFFGPDTYRFAALLRREVGQVARAVDLGCGSGAGGLCLASRVEQLVLADVSEAALRLAAINAALAGAKVTLHQSDVLQQVPGTFDLVIANPPFLVDEGKRTYRDGGSRGIELSVRIAREGFSRLAPGGRLILYTATPVVEGTDLLAEALAPLRAEAASFEYEELDPDVFGEELERPAYQDVDRLSLVVCIASRGS